MLKKGMLLKCKTQTKNDVFGTVLWEIVEVGLPAPEPTRKGEMDGVQVVLVGGSGSSARAGLILVDSEKHIMSDINDGITQIVTDDMRESILNQFKKSKCTPTSHSGTGVVEL